MRRGNTLSPSPTSLLPKGPPVPLQIPPLKNKDKL